MDLEEARRVGLLADQADRDHEMAVADAAVVAAAVVPGRVVAAFIDGVGFTREELLA